MLPLRVRAGSYSVAYIIRQGYERLQTSGRYLILVLRTVVMPVPEPDLLSLAAMKG